MDHDEELHKPVVHVARRRRLQNEDVFVTDRLANGDAGLLVGVVQAHRVGNFNAKAIYVHVRCMLPQTRQLREMGGGAYRLATLALSSGWEVPEMSLISLAI